MTKNLKRRNEFMNDLRSELIRKNSLIRSLSDEKIASLNMKLPAIKPVLQTQTSYSRYRNSIQAQNILSDTMTSIDFNRNLKNLIGFKNLRNVKALFMSRELTMRNSIFEPSRIELNQSDADGVMLRISARGRFKKMINLILIIIKLISIHKVSKEKVKYFGNEIKIEVVDENIFDAKFYARPQEPAFSDEAKKMLGLSPEERTEDILRYIVISLNFSVPEFSELPIRIQKMWAKRAFYQEFEPDRVIVRQGHYPTYYYMIVSGKAMVIEASTSWTSKAATGSTTDDDGLIYTPLLALKRGDCFGDLAIINNSKRTSSIKVSGNKSLGLLCVDKEDFFLIQGSKSPKDKLKFLCSSVPLLNKAEYPFESLEGENKKTIQVCFSMYYRNGVVISENSQQDEWLYVIKSGSCKVIKRIMVDTETVEEFWRRQRSDRDEKLKQIEFMFNMVKHSTYVEPVERENTRQMLFGVNKDKSDMREVFLELPKLQVGDIFGLNDVIFDSQLDGYSCSLMLVSEGVECVLISRRSFLKHLSPQAWFKLRTSSPIYPNDQYFIDKYFGSFVWKDYKSKQMEQAKIKDKIR